MTSVNKSMSAALFRRLKNNANADNLRKLANHACENKEPKKMAKALKLFNKSLCYAENDENLAIGYAVRSGIYFDLKLYPECLRSIQLVRSMNGAYSEEIKDEIDRRELLCMDAIAMENPALQMRDPLVAYINFPAHNSVPYIAGCLQLQKSPEFGRHIITAKALKPGDVIAIEKPFCTAPSKDLQYERCENCTEERSLNLIPCPSCTLVVFCSVECQKEALAGFHKYECPIIHQIMYKIPLPNCRLTLRLIVCGLMLFENLDDFLDFTEKAMAQECTVFTIDSGQMNEQYAAVCSLQRADEPDNLTLKNLEDICLLLFKQFGLTSNKQPEEFERILREIIKNHYLMIELNRLIIQTHIHMNEPDCSTDCPHYFRNDKDNALGVYAFLSLFNHSCCPNVIITASGNEQIASVVRPIKAGEQLFIGNR